MQTHITRTEHIEQHSSNYNTELNRVRGDLLFVNNLLNGENATHWFRGECSPTCKHDMEYARDLMHTYKRQAETGTTCLMLDLISKESLDKKHTELNEKILAI